MPEEKVNPYALIRTLLKESGFNAYTISGMNHITKDRPRERDIIGILSGCENEFHYRSWYVALQEKYPGLTESEIFGKYLGIDPTVFFKIINLSKQVIVKYRKAHRKNPGMEKAFQLFLYELEGKSDLTIEDLMPWKNESLPLSEIQSLHKQDLKSGKFSSWSIKK